MLLGQEVSFLHPSYFWALMYEKDISKKRNIRKFQFVQNSRANILIKLVSDPLTNEEKSFIISDIKRRIGDIDIKFSYESDIANTKTGKYRAVINNLKE